MRKSKPPSVKKPSPNPPAPSVSARLREELRRRFGMSAEEADRYIARLRKKAAAERDGLGFPSDRIGVPTGDENSRRVNGSDQPTA